MKMLNVSFRTECRECHEFISYIGFAESNELKDKVIADSVTILEMDIDHYVIGDKEGIMIPVEVSVTCPHCGEVNKFGNAVCIE